MPLFRSRDRLRIPLSATYTTLQRAALPSTLLSALFSALLLAGPATAAGVPLTLCYEDVAQRPWSAPDATGLNFELLRRAAKLTGEQFIYAAKPWRRCIEELRLGTVDGVIAAADSRDRRAFAAYPLLPDGSADPARALFTDTVNVFLRVGGQASWDGRTLVAPNMEVAVQSGYLVGSVLRERGYRPREMGKSAEDGLRLLLNGMFDVAILQGVEASRLVHNDPRFQNQIVQAAPPYRVVALHLPFNRELYYRNPRRMEAIWRAIASARQAPDYRHLEAEAGVRD